jgi:outer membrane receptor protein involved in Fe transport
LNGPNYITNVSNPENLYSFDIKGDYDFGKHGRLFARESYARRDFYKSPPGGNVFLFTDPNAFTRNHNTVIGHNIAFRPTLLNELRLGYNRFDTNDYGNDFGTDKNAQLGLANADVAGQATSGIADFTAGTGISELGTQGWTNAQRLAQYYQITDGVTWIRGRHTFKFGFDGRRIESTLTNPDQSPRGVFNYSANQTSNNGVNGDAFASYLLGFPNQVQRGFVLTRPYIWTNEGGIYGQDNWRLTPELTLNLGLRWEFLTPYADKYNRESNFNLTTGLFDLANPQNRVPNVNTQYADFAPRLGIAYAPNTKLVLRGAFGTSYYSQGGSLYGGTLERNFPFFQTLSLTGPNSYQPFWKISQNNGLPFGNLPYTPIQPPPSTPTQPNATLAPISGVVPIFVPQALRPTRIYVWNFGAQWEIEANSALQINYVATDGSFLTRSFNINIPYAPSASPLVDTARPYYSISPLTPNINFRGTDGASRYNSLQVSYTHRYSHGFQALLAYTFAHSKTNTGAGQFFFPWNDSLNWGPNSQRQVFTGSWTYDLPFGQDRKFLSGSSGLVQAIAGGWSFNGIATVRSGSPLSVGSHNNTLNLGIGNRANVTCSSINYPKSINKWFDTSCFTDPPPQTFGNAKNGTLWGPGVVNFDLSGFKTFKVESVTTQFRAEFFNAFNNPHFSSPNTSFGSGSFGKITNTTLTAREIQLGLRLLF